MPKEWRYLATLIAMLTIGAAEVGMAQTSPPASDTYIFPAEFVSVDVGGSSLTVKPGVAYTQAMSELQQFKSGEPVWVVWSGVHNTSDSVRQIRRPAPGRTIDEDLVLPAEFVSSGAPSQSVTIKVKIPTGSVAALQAVRPGQWVRVTARHRPSTEADAVTAVQPYNSVTTPR